MAQKQSILGRISQLTRANINALLDRAEDPEKMLDQLVRDYTNSIAEAEEAVAQTIANTRLADGDLSEEIARLRAEPGGGNIGVGGAGLAAEAARLGLLDEYRVRVYPVLVGGGIPYFPQQGTATALERVEGRSFACGVDFVHYRVLR